MKTLFLATALLLATASPGWSEDKEADKELKALYERAAPTYKDEFNMLVETGKFEPSPANIRGKEGTLERKLWLAGYYSAVMSYMEPSNFRGKPEETGRGYPAGPGVRRYYSLGWLSGIRKTAPVATKLHTQIIVKLLEEDENAAAKARQDKLPSTPRK